jgi:uncharacterized protein
MADAPARIVLCPTCRKPVHWSETNRFRPFCSDRCRLIDLGAWAAEQHRIPADERDDESESEDPDQD